MCERAKRCVGCWWYFGHGKPGGKLGTCVVDPPVLVKDDPCVPESWSCPVVDGKSPGCSKWRDTFGDDTES